MQKIYSSAEAALEGLLFDGMTIAAGGFGLCGIPERLIDAIQASGVKDLTFASNNAGIDNEGLGKLLRTRQVKQDDLAPTSARTRSSSGNISPASSRSSSARRARSPSGCARAARASPASTPRPASAPRSPRARKSRSSTARNISSSAASAPTSSIVKGWKADESGNLVFRKTARNFNLPAATCGKICVAEVEEIVPVGSLDPDCIHLPAIYVKRLILGAPYDKKIEFRTVREREAA